jgi:hypothetical protein
LQPLQLLIVQSKERTRLKDIDAGKVVNTALATAKDPKGNSVTDISNYRDNDTPTDTPLTQTPRIASVTAVGGTGK